MMRDFFDNLLVAIFVLMVIGFIGLLGAAIFSPGRESCRDGYVEVRNVCVQGYVPDWKK